MGSTLSAPIESKIVQRLGTVDYRVSAVDMQGLRLEMEDAHCVAFNLKTELGSEGAAGSQAPPEPTTLFAVFDGHCGDKAAKFAASNLPRYLKQAADLSPESLEKACISLDAEFLAKQLSDGCTAVFALCRPRAQPDSAAPREYDITVCNIGDSRCLIGRADGSFEGLTEDHKPGNPIETQRINAAGGHVSFGRVDGQLAVSRAFGDLPYKRSSELPPEEQKVVSVPEITTTVARSGDFLVLACDGIFEQMKNDQVMRVAFERKAERDDPAHIAIGLMDASVKSGSQDNMTAMVVQFADGRAYAAADEYMPGPLSVRLARDNNFVSAYVADARRAGLRVEQAEPDKDRNGRGRGSRSLSPLSDEEGPAPMAVDGDNTTASHTHDPNITTSAHGDGKGFTVRYVDEKDLLTLGVQRRMQVLREDIKMAHRGSEDTIKALDDLANEIRQRIDTALQHPDPIALLAPGLRGLPRTASGAGTAGTAGAAPTTPQSAAVLRRMSMIPSETFYMPGAAKMRAHSHSGALRAGSVLQLGTTRVARQSFVFMNPVSADRASTFIGVITAAAETVADAKQSALSARFLATRLPDAVHRLQSVLTGGSGAGGDRTYSASPPGRSSLGGRASSADSGGSTPSNAGGGAGRKKKGKGKGKKKSKKKPKQQQAQGQGQGQGGKGSSAGSASAGGDDAGSTHSGSDDSDDDSAPPSDASPAPPAGAWAGRARKGDGSTLIHSPAMGVGSKAFWTKAFAQVFSELNAKLQGVQQHFTLHPSGSENKKTGSSTGAAGGKGKGKSGSKTAAADDDVDAAIEAVLASDPSIQEAAAAAAEFPASIDHKTPARLGFVFIVETPAAASAAGSSAVVRADEAKGPTFHVCAGNVGNVYAILVHESKWKVLGLYADPPAAFFGKSHQAAISPSVCVGQATAGDYLIIVPRHTLVLDQDYHQEKDDVVVPHFMEKAQPHFDEALRMARLAKERPDPCAIAGHVLKLLHPEPQKYMWPEQMSENLSLTLVLFGNSGAESSSASAAAAAAAAAGNAPVAMDVTPIPAPAGVAARPAGSPDKTASSTTVASAAGVVPYVSSVVRGMELEYSPGPLWHYREEKKFLEALIQGAAMFVPDMRLDQLFVHALRDDLQRVVKKQSEERALVQTNINRIEEEIKQLTRLVDEYNRKAAAASMDGSSPSGSPV